jgi:Na+/citrate or Na+/malate symporter
MIAVIITITISTIISILWANGIHNMKEEHPDYKGDDFLQNK